MGSGKNRIADYLAKRRHYWFDAVFVCARWYERKRNGFQWKLNLEAEYRIVGGPLDGFHLTLKMPVVALGKLVEDTSMVHKIFVAEGLTPEDGDTIGADLCNAILGKRPVRLHCPPNEQWRVTDPDNIMMMPDHFITNGLGWHLNDDGTAEIPNVARA